MPSIILSDNGVSSGSAGLKTTAASDGSLALQTTTAGGTATTAVTIDTSQNVGIGTASPGAKLEVNDATRASVFVQDSAGRRLRLQSPDSSANPATIGTSTNHDLLIEVGSSGAGANVMRFNTAGSERMRLDANGNLIVGGTSPTTSSGYTSLSINNATNSGYVVLQNNGTNKSDWFVSGGTAAILRGVAVPLILTATGANYLSFETNGSERARIDSSGNLIVGGTTPSAKFTVTSSTSAFNAPTIFAQNSWSGDVGYAALYISKYDNNSTTSQILVRFAINANAAGQGQINANGANAAAFGTFSDSRLKENIVDLPPQLANIMSLRPVEYDYIESEGGGHQVGFVAQEVQAIYPDLVGEREDGMLTLTDLNKNDARLIKAIQEQQAQISSQAAVITTLTERITALEAK